MPVPGVGEDGGVHDHDVGHREERGDAAGEVAVLARRGRVEVGIRHSVARDAGAVDVDVGELLR